MANVLSQMSQFVHQPSDKGPVQSKEDLEHTYAQNLTTNLTKPDKRKAIEVAKKGTVKAPVESPSASIFLFHSMAGLCVNFKDNIQFFTHFDFCSSDPDFHPTQSPTRVHSMLISRWTFFQNSFTAP